MAFIGKDRSYYRLEKNQTLIEEAKENPNPELAVVLAERLADAEWDVREAEHLRTRDY